MIFTNNPDHTGSSLRFIQGVKILAKGRDDTLILVGILSEDILDNYYSFLDHVVYLDILKLADNLRIVDIKINDYSSLLFDFKINLIFSLFNKSVYNSMISRETRTANQRGLEILNFARLLMSELLLVGNWQGEKKWAD